MDCAITHGFANFTPDKPPNYFAYPMDIILYILYNGSTVGTKTGSARRNKQSNRRYA